MMSYILAVLIRAGIGFVALIAGFLIFRKKLSKSALLAGILILTWLCVFSSYIVCEMKTLTDKVTVTALGEHDDIIISGFTVNKEKVPPAAPVGGVWASYESNGSGGGHLLGWLPGDEKQPDNATCRVELAVPVGRERAIEFLSNPQCGKAQVEANGNVQIIDTRGENRSLSISIGSSTSDMLVKNSLAQLPYFIIIFLACCLLLFLLAFLFTKEKRVVKLEKYQFLFSQLVKRDFTLKYKRTILGMLWSILSPLLNLLIMYIVFNKLLGNNVAHFVIYLFAGQLVYSYFSDATSQGMTSLIENSSIFTKINIPKYMFLLSKNVSSLINFGITLIVFFIFVIFEGIPFTWKYLMLIYPIGCLVVFNIGMGLCLSALNVFFRDMQYLWGILVQIIMWLSAIFYSIDSYPQFGQNLFLLNPIYLFIRYFRKIVIDASVPTIWFHLLMLGYTIVILLFGFRMYKKYNHEFLYYV